MCLHIYHYYGGKKRTVREEKLDLMGKAKARKRESEKKEKKQITIIDRWIEWRYHVR